VATAENGGDGRVLFLSSLSRLRSVKFRLNGEQNGEQNGGREGRAENEEREKNQTKREKGKKKALNRGGEKYFFIRWIANEECTVATVALWFFFFTFEEGNSVALEQLFSFFHFRCGDTE
jgi:hypothetical protein